LKHTNQFSLLLAKSIFLLWFVLSLNALKAQDSIKSKKVKILPVPSIGYTPETKTYFGAVSLFTLDFYQDGKTRTSNAKLENSSHFFPHLTIIYHNVEKYSVVKSERRVRIMWSTRGWQLLK